MDSVVTQDVLNNPTSTRGINWRWTLGWIVIAFALRVAVIFATSSYEVGDKWSPQTGYEMGRIARNITEGYGLSLRGGTYIKPAAPTPTAWFGPVYPYYLAIFFTIFGSFTSSALFFAQAANSLLSSLTILPLCVSAQILFGGRVARFAAPVWAFWPHAVIQSSYLWHSNFLTLLLCLLFWLTITLPNRRHWFNSSSIIGILASLACLTDGVVTVTIAAILLWILLQRNLPMTRRIACCMTIGVIILVSLIPWTARNYQTVGKFIPLRSSLGLNIFIGNNPEADGDYHWPSPIIDRYITEHERSFLSTANEYEFSQFLGDKAKTWIMHNPVKFAQLCVYRVATFWLPELANPKPTSPRWLLRIGTAAPLFALAMAGLFMTYFRHPQARLLCLWMLVYPVGYYATHASVPRYRYPTFPFQILLALVAILAMANAIARWRRGSRNL